MSLQSRLADLIAAIGADVKALYTAPIERPMLSSTPSAASSGTSKIYPRDDGFWYSIDEVGLEKNLIDPISAGRGFTLPNDGGSNVTNFGSSAPSATGTVTAASRAITNVHTRKRRTDYLVTTAATTAVAGWRVTAGHLVRGNASDIGGFYSSQIFGPATGVATSTTRCFVGLTSSTAAPTDVQPSTLTVCIGVGWGAADTNMKMYYNDASGACTEVDLGASFPVPTSDRTKAYSIEVWCVPNDSKFSWRVKDLGTGAFSKGDTGVSTNIPSNTTYLVERGWMSVGGTSSVIGIAFMGIYFETMD